MNHIQNSGEKINLDKYLVEISSVVFLAKIIFMLLILVLGLFLISLPSTLFKFIGTISAGTMFAHAIELQHQALHYTGFKRKFHNRLSGFILGIPMLSSFSHYQHDHLKHHRLLGTDKNKEFFEYKRDNNFLNFFSQLLCLNIYSKAMRSFFICLTGKNFDGIFKEKTKQKIRNEYLIIFTILILSVIISVHYQSFFLLKYWLIPLFFVAGPVHSLIELPEHFGCDQRNRSTFYNTRSIRNPSKILVWLTNGNNYHIERHTYPAVPMQKLQHISKDCLKNARYQNGSYFEFYFSLFKNFKKGETP